LGTSGAAALSLALALNEALSLGLTKIEAAQIAHIAEVECKTGLGTVIAETFGGVEIRVKPGAPGIGEIKQMLVPKDTVVACLVFGPLSTRKLLSDKETRKRVNLLGGELVGKLVKEPSISNFMKRSRQFAEHVGLITDKIGNALELADNSGVLCSMPMFGESVFTLVERGSSEQLLKIFQEHRLDGRAVLSEIDFEGARLLV
jgi:pantoate kinase